MEQCVSETAIKYKLLVRLELSSPFTLELSWFILEQRGTVRIGNMNKSYEPSENQTQISNDSERDSSLYVQFHHLPNNNNTGQHNVWFNLVWFYGTSNVIGYLMTNLVFTYISNIWFVNTFSRYTQLKGQTVLFLTIQFTIYQQS